MFGYKTYLVLGDLAQIGVNIPFLTNNGYELSNCQYSFNKSTDEKGQVKSYSSGGTFHLDLTEFPSTELINWSINPRVYKDGVIIIIDNRESVLEKIYFKHAACVSFEISYINTGQRYVNTSLILSADTLSFTNTIFNNKWVNS